VKQVTFAGPLRYVDNYATFKCWRIVGFLIANDSPLHWASRLKRNLQAVAYRQRKRRCGPVASASAAAAGAGGAAVSLSNQMLRTATFSTVEAELTQTVTTQNLM